MSSGNYPSVEKKHATQTCDIECGVGFLQNKGYLFMSLKKKSESPGETLDRCLDSTRLEEGFAIHGLVSEMLRSSRWIETSPCLCGHNVDVNQIK